MKANSTLEAQDPLIFQPNFEVRMDKGLKLLQTASVSREIPLQF